MYIRFLQHKALLRTAIATAVVARALLPSTAFAQAETQPRFELRPHCENPATSMCPSFEVRDPESLQTEIYKIGDTIDVDLIIHNPEGKAVERFRAWIAYDPSLLKGMEIAIDEDFPTPTPGETDFDEDTGYIKLSGTAVSAPTDTVIVAARMQFTIQDTRTAGTPMLFYDDIATDDAETGIFVKDGSNESNILINPMGYLLIRMEESAEATSSVAAESATSSASPTDAGTTASSAASSVVAAPSAVFTMLQVQGVRVTTEGSSVFLAWDVLPSSELIGYNIYYGTVSGRYIQRRSVDKNASNITIRALPVGTPYYFAVRGINAAGQETEFSQEVGVGVGDPKTSTSPLTAGTIPTKTPTTGGTVAGDTGVETTLMLFLAISAVIGTVIAFRRQLVAAEIKA